MVGAEDAAEIIGWAEQLGIGVRLDGGWGVDALLGCQTREHNDIDLFIERGRGREFTSVLQRAGFREVTMGYTTPVHTVWQDHRGRIVDLHLFETAPDGSLLFEGTAYPASTFGATGWIAGKGVRCIPAAEQVLFHQGYDFDQNDVHDVRLLCERFGIEVPEVYKQHLTDKV